MAVKIAVTREYEDEKRHVHSNRLLLFLLPKKLTALSDIFFLLLEVMHLAVQWVRFVQMLYFIFTLLSHSSKHFMSLNCVSSFSFLSNFMNNDLMSM